MATRLDVFSDAARRFSRELSMPGPIESPASLKEPIMPTSSREVTNEMIRRFVDKHGWALAKADKILGPVIRKMRDDQRKFSDSIIEPV